MEIDMTSVLLNSGLKEITEYSQVSGKQNGADGIADAEKSDFLDVLTDEVAKLTENSSKTTELEELSNLIDSLDQSILGGVLSNLDTEEVAESILSDKSGGDVVEQLVSGHLQSIVMTPQKDENAETSMTSDVGNGIAEEVSTETLSENLETILASLNTTVTGI